MLRRSVLPLPQPERHHRIRELLNRRGLMRTGSHRRNATPAPPAKRVQPR